MMNTRHTPGRGGGGAGEREKKKFNEKKKKNLTASGVDAFLQRGGRLAKFEGVRHGRLAIERGTVFLRH